jgi:ATP-dependent Clp protease ATP-binding subunit ClpA
LQRVIDDEIKKPLSRMILFGELSSGGMVEVGLVYDKLTVNFKAKKEPQTIDQFKPKMSDEKTS